MAKNKNKKKKRQPSSTNNSRKFEVGPQETIDQCLDRIEREGFVPVRRTEEPVFQEVEENGEITYEPVGRKIVFDVKPSKSEQ
ncbi:NETI motif-containing protein [Sediminibacillus massiliensis]|uniref:NETI motif-containing protein n=1 Tax=Sediminibacillus massiliensis TaxID=1926277 RepID=UPI00098877C0|nr:NETI motif-containing protein [Sediminibacillus massiliensis]